MTATALILSVLGAFTAFTDTEPIYNVLGVLLLIGLRMFIKLTRRGIQMIIGVFGKPRSGKTQRAHISACVRLHASR